MRSLLSILYQWITANVTHRTFEWLNGVVGVGVRGAEGEAAAEGSARF